MPPSIPPHQTVQPWTKDISLYEEYKMRRNELRRRRRRELEKTLPQPLLAEMVRERREKTRLRVARWRAKRKLQACLDQAQALGGAVGLSQTDFPISSPGCLVPPPPVISSGRAQLQADGVSTLLHSAGAPMSV
ncbi:uncharacterized protein si:ch211-67e16.4 [Brachionichthys hirsutus]|uniref:uncharacterized protein si:ch211-67e16.4 n=1 Tax=Brachionichthys hirsutus TaxID=412623 RepID=UPI003604D6B1